MANQGTLIINKGRRPTLWTRNAYPGKTHFDEKTIFIEGQEYREFSPMRSKLAAALASGISQIGIKEGHIVLYLGASHGYTPSFVSDLVGTKGTIFALDVAPRVVRDLTFLAEERTNIIPLMEDCNHPEHYASLLPAADIVYQDIAQRNQLEIFLKNLRFLKPRSFGLLAIKSRSIDVTKHPRDVYKDVRRELERKVTIVDNRELDPYEKDHCLFVIKT
jgi:fibrillarin-like pre-rRNA processing protein